jgi:hypothetical protein
MWGTIASIAVQAGTSLISGVQAQKMRKEQRKSEQEAANLMKDIYNELEKNQYAAVALPMKSFELEREALAAQGAQAVQAGAESERTAAATAGLTMSQYRKALRDIQSEQADKMLELDLLTAQEAARKGDIKMQFKAQEAEGAAAAAADYEQRKLAAVGGAIEGAIGAAGTAMAAIPLFKASKGVRAASNLEDAYQKAFGMGNLSPDLYDSSGNPLSASMAIAKRLGLDEAKLKELGMYTEAGQFDDAKFRTYVSQLPEVDLQDVLRSGFEPSSLQQVKPQLMIDRADGKAVYQGEPAPEYDRRFGFGQNFQNILQSVTGLNR